MLGTDERRLRGEQMISAKQIRAGRALLGWTAQDLATKAGTSLDALHRLETEKVEIAKARAGTIQKIEGALRDGGVDLLDNDGVRMRPDERAPG